MTPHLLNSAWLVLVPLACVFVVRLHAVTGWIKRRAARKQAIARARARLRRP